MIVIDMERKPTFGPYRVDGKIILKLFLKNFVSPVDLSCSVHGLAVTPLNVCNKYSAPRMYEIS